MKKICTILLISLLVNPIFAQNKEEEKSKSNAIAFSSRQGSLITKSFYPLGKIKGVEFEVLLLTDEVKKDKTACLRLKTYSSTTEQDYIGTLDADELNAGIQSLTYIKEKLMPTTPEVYTECTYKSKDGVMFGAFSSEKGWSPYIYTKSYTSRSACFLENGDLALIIDKMKEAQAKITTVLK